MAQETQPPILPHRWNYDARRWVVIGLVVAGAIFAYFIRDTLPVLILAVLVAYLLNPIVTILTRRLKLPRILAAALTYVVLIAILIELGILIAPNIARQVSTLVGDFDVLVVRLLDVGKQIPVLVHGCFPARVDEGARVVLLDDGGSGDDVAAEQLRAIEHPRRSPAADLREPHLAAALERARRLARALR